MLNKIKSLFKNKYFLSLILGSISALTFAPLYLFPLAIFAFSGWFLIGNSCKDNKESFLIGWFFGFGQFIFGLYWICISLFVDISKFFWLLPFALFLIPAVLAIYTGLALLLTNFIATKLAIKDWRKILLLAVIWVFFEFLRSTLFTGFPWNLLGYSLLFSLPLSQAASVVGIYGLSLLAIIFYCFPALFIQTNNDKIKFHFDKKLQPFYISLILSISLIWLAGFFRINNFQPNFFPNATFRLVQPSIAQENKWNPESRYDSFLENIRLSHRLGFDKVNYVVWSESAVPYVINQITSYGLLSNIASAAPQDGFIITGALKAEFKEGSNDWEREPSKIWNTIFVINHDAKVITNYDKNHLVPFGEYIPFSDSLPFISKITDGAINFSQGNGLKTIKLNSKTPSFSPLICYEAIFSGNVIDKSHPPQFLLNLTNDAWFGLSFGPYQHFDMVRMRSIENGMPTIRVANSGISGLIDPLGKIVALIPLNKKDILDVMLMENLPATIYMRYGNKILILISTIILSLAFLKRR
jgi:apolipoprotein N-acyltransferase